MRDHEVAEVCRDSATFETHLRCQCGFDAHAFGVDGVRLVTAQHDEHLLSERHLDRLAGEETQ